MPTRHAFVLGAATFLFCLIGLQTVLVEQWLEMQEQRERQAQIRQDILRLERLVADVDHGFRGYALMKQGAFLRPMVNAEASIPRIVEGLGDMTEPWPDLKGRVQVIHDRVDELLHTTRRLTMAITSGQDEHALGYIRDGEGLALSHTIALAFQELDHRLQQRQREWDRDHAHTIQWVRWGVPVTALGGVACGISIGRTTGRLRMSRNPQDASDETRKSQAIRQCSLV